MANRSKVSRIIDLLEVNGTLSTHQIYDDINSSMRWGVTMNQLANLLSGNLLIEKIGKIESYTGLKRIRCSLWRLK